MSNIEELIKAIDDPGVEPNYHYYIMARHRKEWPTLWRVLDEMIEEYKNEY